MAGAQSMSRETVFKQAALVTEFFLVKSGEG